MESLIVECLSCGHERTLDRPEGRVLASGECDRCGYLGWAPAGALDDETRRLLRELPVEQRQVPLRAA